MRLRCAGCGKFMAWRGGYVRRGGINTGLMMRLGVITHTDIDCQWKSQGVRVSVPPTEG